MALDEIKKSIMHDAYSRSSAIESEAGRQVSAIRHEAEESAKHILKSAEEEAEKEVVRLKNEHKAALDMEVSALILDAKGKAVERSLKAVMEKVRSSMENEEGMKKILAHGIKQFAEIASEDAIIVSTSKRNAATLKGKGYDIEYADVDGFMLYTKDKRIALNATVSNIVNGEADAARRVVAAELFGSRQPARKHISTPAAPKKAKNAAHGKKPVKAKKAGRKAKKTWRRAKKTRKKGR
jgi:vacuolar-type H+-ATPase subunit E/Vma4